MKQPSFDEISSDSVFPFTIKIELIDKSSPDPIEISSFELTRDLFNKIKDDSILDYLFNHFKTNLQEFISFKSKNQLLENIPHISFCTTKIFRQIDVLQHKFFSSFETTWEDFKNFIKKVDSVVAVVIKDWTIRLFAKSSVSEIFFNNLIYREIYSKYFLIHRFFKNFIKEHMDKKGIKNDEIIFLDFGYSTIFNWNKDNKEISWFFELNQKSKVCSTFILKFYFFSDFLIDNLFNMFLNVDIDNINHEIEKLKKSEYKEKGPSIPNTLECVGHKAGFVFDNKWLPKSNIYEHEIIEKSNIKNVYSYIFPKSFKLKELKNPNPKWIQILKKRYLKPNRNTQRKKVFCISFKGIFALTKPHLEKFIALERKNKHDHKDLAKLMDLFFFDKDAGLGFPIWLPNGVIIKEKIKSFLYKKYLKYKFQFVNTPIIGSKNLYLKSGHLKRYYECMFSEINLKDHAIKPKSKGDKNSPVSNESIKNPTDQLKRANDFYLRPMTCPHHCLIFKYWRPTYKSLPIKLAEESPIFRHEYSGALSGLERVRGMELYDAHIFCTEKDIGKTVNELLELTNEVLNKFNIDFFYSLSLGNKSDKTKSIWEKSEQVLEECLKSFKKQHKNITYTKNYGEAAFYGPKIDFQVKTLWDHEITIATLQLDYLLPKKENLNLTYLDKANKPKHPILIHFGIIGTFERFISVLLEQTGGFLPFFITPIQIQIIPVPKDPNKSKPIQEYCEIIKNNLVEDDFRVQFDNSDERLSYKIRYGQVHKIPYQLIIGEKEYSSFKNSNKVLNISEVSYRQYGKKESTLKTFKDFKRAIKKEIDEFLK